MVEDEWLHGFREDVGWHVSRVCVREMYGVVFNLFFDIVSFQVYVLVTL